MNTGNRTERPMWGSHGKPRTVLSNGIGKFLFRREPPGKHHPPLPSFGLVSWGFQTGRGEVTSACSMRCSRVSPP